MPGTTIGIYMNYGYAGNVSRHGDEISRTRPVKKETADIKFGAPVVQNEDGSVEAFGADHTAENFCGVAMRKVKSAKIYPYQNFGYYSAEEPCDILMRGGINVICAFGEPKVGGAVYIRTKVVDGTSPAGAAIGDFGAEDESGNCIKLPESVAKWSTNKDERNVAELTLMTRQGV